MAIEGAAGRRRQRWCDGFALAIDWEALSHGVHFATGVRPYPGQARLRERSIQGHGLNGNVALLVKQMIESPCHCG